MVRIEFCFARGLWVGTIEQTRYFRKRLGPVLFSRILICPERFLFENHFCHIPRYCVLKLYRVRYSTDQTVNMKLRPETENKQLFGLKRTDVVFCQSKRPRLGRVSIRVYIYIHLRMDGTGPYRIGQDP